MQIFVVSAIYTIRIMSSSPMIYSHRSMNMNMRIQDMIQVVRFSSVWSTAEPII